MKLSRAYSTMRLPLEFQRARTLSTIWHASQHLWENNGRLVLVHSCMSSCKQNETLQSYYKINGKQPPQTPSVLEISSSYLHSTHTWANVSRLLVLHIISQFELAVLLQRTKVGYILNDSPVFCTKMITNWQPVAGMGQALKCLCLKVL